MNPSVHTTKMQPIRQAFGRVTSTLFLLGLSLFCISKAQAQVLQATIIGNVISSNTNLGVANKAVLVQAADSLNPFQTTVTTNANGGFTTAVPTRPNAPTLYIVRTMDCLQNMVSTSATVTSGQTAQLSLRVCTTVPVVTCTPAFYAVPDSSNPASFNFVGSARCNSQSGVTGWIWEFSDSTRLTGQNVQHTFSGPGVYNVCLIVRYGNNSQSSTCQRITVLGGQPVCTPRFYWFADTSVGVSGRIRLVNTSNCTVPGIIGTTYNWTLGNGTSSNLPSPIVNYNPGTYTVCLIATMPNGATFNTCQQIVIRGGGPVNCANLPRPGIMQRHDGLNIHFLNTLVNTQGVLYRWDFGDQTPISTLADPRHQYAAPGTYGVCLTITYYPTPIHIGCQITVCDTILVTRGPVTPPAPTRNRIFGTVYKGLSAANQYAVEVVGINGNRFYRFKRFGNDSVYNFDSVPAGRYLVRAWLQRANPDFRNWLPTYHGNKVLWRLATVVNVTSPTTWADINLVPRRARGQRGYRVQGAIGTINMPNAREAATATTDLNTFALLADDNGNPYEVAWLDVNRNYTFDQLDAGTYQLSVESPTMPTAIATITLGGTVDAATVDFGVVNDMMNVTITALDAQQAAASIVLYPNPTTTSLTVKGAAAAKYSVMTATGQTVSTGMLTDADDAKISVAELPIGIYMLQLELASGQRVVRRISKQ